MERYKKLFESNYFNQIQKFLKDIKIQNYKEKDDSISFYTPDSYFISSSKYIELKKFLYNKGFNYDNYSVIGGKGLGISFYKLD